MKSVVAGKDFLDALGSSLTGRIADGMEQLVGPAIPELESGPLQCAVCGAVIEQNLRSP